MTTPSEEYIEKFQKKFLFFADAKALVKDAEKETTLSGSDLQEEVEDHLRSALAAYKKELAGKIKELEVFDRPAYNFRLEVLSLLQEPKE